MSEVLKNQRSVIKPQSELERPQVNWYWTEIKKKAKKYAGWSLDLKLNAGYQIGDVNIENQKVLIGGSIPLYSRKEKLAQNDSAAAFLNKGSALCSQLESALRTYLIYQQAYSSYEMLAQDEGSGMFDKLIAMQIKIVDTEALITQTHRDLLSLLDPFDEDPRIYGWDKDKEKGKGKK